MVSKKSSMVIYANVQWLKVFRATSLGNPVINPFEPTSPFYNKIQNKLSK